MFSHGFVCCCSSQYTPQWRSERLQTMGSPCSELDQFFSLCRSQFSGFDFLFHGYAYQTDCENAEERWLGYSPMAPLFSEELGTRVPSWNLVAPVLTAVSRQQWFLRQGVPVVELAVYRHSDWEDRLHPDYLSDDALNRLYYNTIPYSAYQSSLLPGRKVNFEPSKW